MSGAAGLGDHGDRAGAARVYADLGLAQKRSGQLPEAIASYERALTLDPAQAGVWVNLGRARREAGQLEAALHAFRRALALDPAAQTWSMTSNALREAGRYGAALRAARTALARDPSFGEAHLNEGAALHLLGEIAAAALGYFVASLHPGTREPALANLKIALSAALPAGQSASPCLGAVRRLLEQPGEIGGLFTLAQIAQQQGRPAAALVCLQQALLRRPSASGQLALARLAWDAGWSGLAEAALIGAIELDAPVQAFRLLGAWCNSGDHTPGARALGLLESCPDDAVALAKLGGVAQRLGQPVRALRLYRRLAGLKPEIVESHLYVGTVLTEQGLVTEAARAFERALELDPSRWDVRSCWLFCRALDPELDAPTAFEQHRAFGEQLGASLPPAEPPRASGGAERRLRIGYVSPDFCAHPLSYFFEPVLRAHDRGRFELACYSDVRRPDHVTAQLARLAHEFVPCKGWTHERLAERIRADRIDILVDLAGHTAHNRLPVFARRPSPVQVSWLGYFDTTGLEAIDYRISDSCSVPSAAERWFVERVVRLPRSANCYQPPLAPEPAPPPCLERGFVSFGCFNNPAKIGRHVCRHFARILAAVPRSRLCFKYRSFHDPELRARYTDWFADEGIEPERLSFEGSSPVPEFMAAFSQIDIALDPFPYSGETTALHTLWMGVPLVTLEGPRLVQRLGSRVLRIAGLDAWVAESLEHYLSIATALASDRAALAALRRQLRARLAASPLLDHAGVTRDLESAFTWMWRRASAPTASLSSLPGSPSSAGWSFA